MVSRPEGNFTYSEWMSERYWAVTGGTGRYAAPPTTAAPAAIPPSTAQYHPLPRIAHPPDPIARVVAHQQRSIRHHQESDRSPPARPVGKLPPGDEVVNRSRLTVLHV